MQTLAHQAQFHPLHQGHHHHINQSPHPTHFMHGQQCVPQPQLPEIAHNQQSSTIAQHIACLQSLGHVGGRLHVMVSCHSYFTLLHFPPSIKFYNCYDISLWFISISVF